jgi:hypothetical protein
MTENTEGFLRSLFKICLQMNGSNYLFVFLKKISNFEKNKIVLWTLQHVVGFRLIGTNVTQVLHNYVFGG